MKENLLNLFDNTQNPLILLPKNPYFDQVATATALYLSLKEAGKNPTIFSSTPMLVEANRLVGVDKVVSELGNKNLVIKFVDYESDNVERVLWDLEGTEFQLTVFPKPGFNPPMKENVEFQYRGVNADFVILIGGANESHFAPLATKELIGIPVIHIGRDSLSIPGYNVISLARSAASISEILGELLLANSLPITQDIATNLLMGISENSKNFTREDVNAQTFRVAADLMDRGGEKRDPRPKYTETEKPDSFTPEVAAPKSWLEPKIFKSTEEA